MHLVAPFRRAEMREARAGDESMGGIFVVGGRQHALLLERACEIDGLTDAPVRDEFAE